MLQKSSTAPIESPVTIFTAAQVASILQVSTRTVERLVATNTLAAVRVGRRLRITHDQLQAYLRQESTISASEP